MWAVLVARGPNKVQFWFLALVIGVAAGFAALLFRKAVSPCRAGSMEPKIPRACIHSPICRGIGCFVIPVVGGAAVGLILHHFYADGRVRSVAM